MNIPNFIDSQVINEKGYLTDTWKQILMHLFTQMQIHLSNEGFIVPQQTSANVTKLNLTKFKGAILYNADTDELIVNKAGTFKNVLTT